MTFDPTSVEVTCVTLPKDHCIQVHENTSKYVDTVQWPFFFQNLNQRSLTPRWPLTQSLLRSHVWLYPRIIVSKSLKIYQVCGYSDPFFKNLNQRSLTHRWPLTHSCWGHMCDSTKGSLCPSPMKICHVCKYSDEFCKTLTTITTHNVQHTNTTYYVQNEWT